MSLSVFQDEVTPLAVNSYLVADSDSGDAVLIGPGEYSPVLARHIAERELRVGLILDTHGHFDHIGGNVDAVEALGAPLVCHRDDAGWLTDAVLCGAAMFGFDDFPLRAPDRMIEDGETLEVGALRIEVIHTPGHTPGGVCFLIEDCLFAGDTLFRNGVGRVDLPGGDEEALWRSIRERLLVLPSATVVYPGHGPTTIIGAEAATNPFLS